MAIIDLDQGRRPSHNGFTDNSELATQDAKDILIVNEVERWNPFGDGGISVIHVSVGVSSPESLSRLESTLKTLSPPTGNSEPSPKGVLPLGVPDEQEVVQLRAQLLVEISKQVVQVPRHEVGLLLFIPSKPGHLVRSDILEIRLTDLADAALKSAASALFISSNAVLDPAALGREFENRLSFPIIQPGQRPRKTLALVGSVRKPLVGLGFFRAARALNIGIVQLDRPNHWTSTPEYASWVEAQLPIDRTPDDGLASRIVDAIKGYNKPVEGLVSFFEPLQVGTARAAKELGLPAPPASAFEIATDKQRTSAFQGNAAYRVSSLKEALETVEQHPQLSYPLIVKPCSGRGSEGVFRLDNEADLVQAFDSIDFSRHGAEVVIEPFCDGPEVDANLVLSDGELLFFETSDDLPKDADAASKQDGDLQTFIELANVMPSALPHDEVEILKNSLHQSLVRLGFRTGFYHLQARVQRSRAKYVTNLDGITDLASNDLIEATVEPSAWLLEINARPPGLQESWASRSTYGIDFWGSSAALRPGRPERHGTSPFASV
ncbi:hypothetical protein PFICI_00559 [Pestalotiopsis fici W106-1]|uniref:ATP-grasp domain-containing protein n=1 Tax=Pestalotiopsis fici (strain W106-1 / CGMCC3.15140) TaxID=1229662 RepID=W3XNB0_PESFW|nr:uncharacterized protein PFICI_00559 [Pestalotiopsis fici W106-1]ETS86731.1 hypothetical protein PFICI_00559 [Pestalotiopsis fici W106-1]